MTERRLKSLEFRLRRVGEWRELERIVAQAERDGLARLPPTSAARLPVLHRAALSSASVARATSLDLDLLNYLGALTARSHAVIYGRRAPLRDAFGAFFAVDFPRAVRALAPATALAALALAAGAATAWRLVAVDPSRYVEFVPEALAQGRTPASSTAELRAGLFDGEGVASFAAHLMLHNAMVGVVALAAGMLGGLPALLVLFSNGLILGAFAALYASRGLGVELWGWLLPHGVTELGAIILCGGAGTALGGALFFPGMRTRSAALKHVGASASTAVMGSFLLFVLAGIMEGVFRQEVRSTGLRYAVAATFAAWWAFYFGVFGRRPRRTS
ncbi:MAG TPA: stage II sporulation protein M [Planctomycetota bacterium]|nr:stage II sporulation protein M [Planctomycetota bacterium]